MLRLIMSLCLIMVLPLSVRANDLHLQLESKANEVLLPKTKGITLEQFQKMVVDEDLDIQIAYEKLLQAQRKIGEARAQYFPYGLGTVGAMYLLNIWNPILLVELITSLPSKVYSVQSEKNMSLAEKHSLIALKENIKNQIAHLYYNILKEETALKLTQLQISLNETLLKTYEERVILGLSTEEDVREISRRLISLRDTYLKFSAYLAAEKSAFNQMIAKTPAEARTIELQPVADILNPADFSMDLNSMIESAVARSNEIVAADYMITAASKNRKATKWSILSFQGIGFGYWARVQVAGSKVSQAKLNRQFVEDNLINQVYIAENGMRQSLHFLSSEQSILEDTKFYMNSEIQRFISGMMPLDELIETELIYLKDFNEFMMSHYNSLIKLNDLERVIQQDARTSGEVKTDTVEVRMNNYKRNWYSLSVESSGDKEIKKVDYSFDKYLGLRPMVSYSTPSDFMIKLKLYDPEYISGSVKIAFNDGSTTTKTYKFE